MYPFNEAEITNQLAPELMAVAAKPALVAPAGTVTVAGTRIFALLLLVIETVPPPVFVSVTVHLLLEPEVM